MARKKSLEPLVRITINLYEDDYIKLEELFPSMGKQVAIRTIIRKYITDIEKELKHG